MAKEAAIGKRLKISKAQQNIILAVLIASLFLGAGISLTVHFVKQFSFNVDVIAAQEQSIVSYSNVIETVGICEKPKGSIYTTDELKKCDPDSIDVSNLPGTLRANILTNLAANKALSSVPKATDSGCLNPETNKNYTYKELNEIYDRAVNSEELIAASKLIKSCSALRVIPDALPAFKNEEALLASLNQIFIVSNWEPETLSPSGETTVAPFGSNLNAMLVNIAIEADSATTINVLKNIERSIRQFDVKNATIEWGGTGTLEFRAQASAYFMNESSLPEKSIKIQGEE